MIKVLIVDDEKIVHHGLQALANWEEHGFSLCHHAYNGLQALDILRQNPGIRIVLTDLQMPKMDGLQFLEEVRRAGIDVKIIVLSAHDRYDLIRQAFKLNASDYIIKSEMTLSEILTQLQNAAAQFIAQEADLDIQKRNEAQIKEKHLTDLLKNMHTEPFEKYLKIFEPASACAYFLAACVLTDNYPEITERLALLRSIMNDMLTDGLYAEIAAIAPGELGMVFAFKDKNISSKDGKIDAALHKLKSWIENFMNTSATIGVGNVVSDIDQVGNEYKFARENADLRFVLGKGKIIFPRDARNIVSSDIGSIAGHTRKLVSALREGSTEALNDELRQTFKTISRYNPKNIERVFPYYMEVIFAIMRYLDEVGLETTDIFRRNVNFYDEIYKFTTRDELNNWVSHIVLWVAGCLKEKENDNLNRHVVMARDFIKKHYSEKTLSLKMVSEYVGLSESHLSSIFAKQAGKTFIEYVTELRIEKAKTLLRESNLKIYEIADNVGFANAEYFSRIFKKVVGKSPNAFV